MKMKWNQYEAKKIDCAFLSCHVRVLEWICTLYSRLNVKEFFDRNRRDIWSLSDINAIQTHKNFVNEHSIRKTQWFNQTSPNGWVFIYKLSGCSFESRCSHLKKNSSGIFQPFWNHFYVFVFIRYFLFIFFKYFFLFVFCFNY